MAGILGFEPRMPDSESGALPLGDIPMYVRMVKERSSLDSLGIGATSLGGYPNVCENGEEEEFSGFTRYRCHFAWRVSQCM